MYFYPFFPMNRCMYILYPQSASCYTTYYSTIQPFLVNDLKMMSMTKSLSGSTAQAKQGILPMTQLPGLNNKLQIDSTKIRGPLI